MENTTSIYSKQNPKIRQILEQAGSPAKALCGAFDYAKAKHVVLLCNGFGDIIKKSFPVDNSPKGIEKLLEEVRSTCAHRGIKKEHVFFGGEDSPSYAQNFIQALSDKGYLVARVNAWEAKQQRDNHQASTDQLDVRAIAKTLLSKTSYCDQDQPKAILTLKEFCRTRSHFVDHSTEQKLHIHHQASRLFPQFLNQKQSGIAPFSRSGLALMAEGFCPEQIRRRRRDHLVGFLQRHGQEDPEQAADKLKALAAEVLAPCSQMLVCWQAALAQHVLQYQSLCQSVGALEKEMARSLAKTGGALLTTVGGVGVVLASGILAEFGDPAGWKAVRFLCSYSGIVPRTSQTGGPDKPAHTGTVQRRCNRRAKNWIVQAASSIGKCGPTELQSQYAQLQANGQHADFVMSKRLLRIFKDLVRRGTVYRPKALLSPETPTSEWIAYYRELWDRLLKKWHGLIEWEELFDPCYPLGQWRQMAQELYKLSLPLPKKRPGKAP